MNPSPEIPLADLLKQIAPLPWKVMPTSITGQSLLVLPDPGYHTPKLSLQMDTQLACSLAHCANVLPELVEALKEIAALERWSCDVVDGTLGKEKDGPWVLINHAKLNRAIARAEKVKLP